MMAALPGYELETEALRREFKAMLVKAVAAQSREGSAESLGDALDVPLSFEPSQPALRFLMVAGGTGGHIFPVLAVAEELRARGARWERAGRKYRIEFVGTTRPLEARLIPGAGFPLRAIKAVGFKGLRGLRAARNLMLLPRTAVAAARVLRDFQPHAVVGVGGYLAGPVMVEAALQDIPTLLIEPNALPGFTNRALAPVVRWAAVGFEQAARFYGEKARITGLPVRAAFHTIPSKRHKPPFTILIVGGSQGSKAINDLMVQCAPFLRREAGWLDVVHQTGETDYNAVRESFLEHGVTAHVHAFIEDMPGALAQADLVVSRAGAAALAELAAAGRAALLIPFPAATDQHQLANARALERAGAARVILQAELTPERLIREIHELLGEPLRLEGMERAAKSLAHPEAAAQIADLVEGMVVHPC
jgi:UDP-N-acetylglucosamine--N-acetylmuramyl-(pentapeptide) pyrophosphoryl-undecaprenol N-acetylglucosamine transferase